ncbi:toll/interleukin-1 receptor domain-containing protein [Deinococcus sp. PEB2-67]
MPGINRAVLSEQTERIIKSFHSADPYDGKRACVFISYKGADIDMARAAAKALKAQEIDIWFDEHDPLLTIANQAGNHAEVVRRIEEGIANSTHILVMISESTKESWWVSFEIGSARRKEAEVAYIPRNNVTYLPSYLKIATQIKSDLSFVDWVKTRFTTFMTKSYSMDTNSVSIPSIPIVERAEIPFYEMR